MGVARLFLLMFLRKLKNRSGSISVQIILKASGKYKVVKTIGTGSSEQEIVKIWFLGKQELERLNAQSKLFVSENDLIVEQVFESLKNANIRTVGPELFSAGYTTTLVLTLSTNLSYGIWLLPV